VRGGKRLVVALLAACGGSATAPARIESTGRGGGVVDDGHGRFFVIADSASICPSAAEALANGCGHSIEDSREGYRLTRGDDLVATGPAEDGVLRASRWMMEGELPGFVAAERLARAPNLDELTAFRAAHADHVLIRGDEISLAVDEEGDLSSPIELLIKGTAYDAYPGTDDQCFADAAGRTYDQGHSCFDDACAELSYRCDEIYCDEIAVVIEDGQLRALADRRGVFQPTDC